MGIFDEAEKSSFARLLNSGGSEKDGNLGRFSESFDGGGKTAKILKVEIEKVGGFGCESLGLLGSPAENRDNGLRGSGESGFLGRNGFKEGRKDWNGREGQCSYFLGNVGTSSAPIATLPRTCPDPVGAATAGKHSKSNIQNPRESASLLPHFKPTRPHIVP